MRSGEKQATGQQGPGRGRTRTHGTYLPPVFPHIFTSTWAIPPSPEPSPLLLRHHRSLAILLLWVNIPKGRLVPWYRGNTWAITSSTSGPSRPAVLPSLKLQWPFCWLQGKHSSMASPPTKTGALKLKWTSESPCGLAKMWERRALHLQGSRSGVESKNSHFKQVLGSEILSPKLPRPVTGGRDRKSDPHLQLQWHQTHQAKVALLSDTAQISPVITDRCHWANDPILTCCGSQLAVGLLFTALKPTLRNISKELQTIHNLLNFELILHH